MVEDSLEIVERSRVGQRVERDDIVLAVLEEIADVVGADKACSPVTSIRIRSCAPSTYLQFREGDSDMSMLVLGSGVAWKYTGETVSRAIDRCGRNVSLDSAGVRDPAGTTRCSRDGGVPNDSGRLSTGRRGQLCRDDGRRRLRVGSRGCVRSQRDGSGRPRQLLYSARHSVCSCVDGLRLRWGASKPYDGAASTDPRQVYGESKLAGEEAVQNVDGDVLVARFSFVRSPRRYGRTRRLPRAWVRNTLANSDDVLLFIDQHLTPTRAGQAADTFLDLLEAEAKGLYHVTCRSCVTPYALGHKIGPCRVRTTRWSMKASRRISREIWRDRHTHVSR